MQKHFLTAALAAAFLLPAVVQAEEEGSPFSANIGLVSDYVYRGVSQTKEKPALQGGFDFKHSSGVYVGTWGSNVSWLRDAEADKHSGNSVELDVYAGYATSFGDFGIDVGVLRYNYPGNYNRTWREETGLKNPNTTELYVGGSWKFLNLKYSRSFTNLFGWEDSKGSTYLDLGVSHEVIKDLSVDAHSGIQRVTGPGYSYKDWKAGVTYKLAGFDIGLHYIDTDVSKREAGGDNDLQDARLILSIARSF